MKIIPAKYAELAMLANTIGEEMLARLSWMTFKPELIVDVGCGVGHCTALLAEHYPDATVLAIDIDPGMLSYAKASKLQESSAICADGLKLPLADQSVDLVFANLVLPWCGDMEKALREWRRVLRQDGLLMFTCLGPDTLRQFRDDFDADCVPEVLDMHIIGDLLTRIKFADPVMDVDYLTLTYREIQSLLEEMQATAILSASVDVDASVRSFQAENGLFAATFEVIYGHAFGPDPLCDQTQNAEGIINIPLSRVGWRRR